MPVTSTLVIDYATGTASVRAVLAHLIPSCTHFWKRRVESRRRMSDETGACWFCEHNQVEHSSHVRTTRHE